MMSKRIVGNIAGFHGVKGEIKVFPLVDDLAVFYDFKNLYISDKQYKIDSIRPHKNLFLVKLVELNSLNDVQILSGYIEAELDEELSDDEIYIDDLISMPVYDQNLNEVGIVSNYFSSGQKLVAIKAKEELKCKRELLIPFVDEYILNIDKKKNFLQIKLDDDLLELAQ